MHTMRILRALSFDLLPNGSRVNPVCVASPSFIDARLFGTTFSTQQNGCGLQYLTLVNRRTKRVPIQGKVSFVSDLIVG